MNKTFKNIHWQVANAINAGLMTRQPCEVCGAKKNIEGHHEDYDKPLEVKWLCRKHHIGIYHKRPKQDIKYSLIPATERIRHRLKVRAARSKMSMIKFIDELSRS